MRVASVLNRAANPAAPQPVVRSFARPLASTYPADRFQPRFAASEGPKQRNWWTYMLMAALGLSSALNGAVFMREFDKPAPPAPSREAMERINRVSDGRIGWDDMVYAVEQATPSTAFISGSGGSGSGIIMKASDGRLLVLTNAHVLEDKSENLPENAEYQVRLYNGSDTKAAFTFSAKLLQTPAGKAYSASKKNDLAVLEIPANVILPRNVKPVAFRDIAKYPLRVGEPVMAVGAPYGYSDSVTIGILSHLDRTYAIEPDNRFFQHSAPIGPGNSGGGLFVMRMEDGELKVELVGINTLNIRNAEGFGGAIHPDVIQKMLQSWNILP